MKSLSVWVRENLPGLIHHRFRSFILHHISLLDKRTEWWISKDPYRNDLPYSTYKSKYPIKLGIVKEFWHRHWPYIAACRDLRVAYRVLDISSPDWIEAIKKSECNAFLIWPSIQLSLWKQMFDERLKIITENLDKIIYPSYHELWLYESKRRMYYWIKANNLPCVKTWIFYSKEEALNFIPKAIFPIVGKSNMGARAAGVHIFRSPKQLDNYIKKCFKKGILHSDSEAQDREWGFVILQEYLPDVSEWRMIRIGDSFFGYEKLKVGDFHSGSHAWRYATPSDKLLNFTKMVTDIGNFSSMNVDIFIGKDNNYLINELQPVFVMFTSDEPQCVINGKPGRITYDSMKQTWNFEQGNFCKNFLCNLRIKEFLKSLKLKNV